VVTWIKNHLLICFLGCFILGIVGAGITVSIIDNGRLGQLDKDIAAGRATIERLTAIGSELTAENTRLTSLNEQQRRGITEAIEIIRGQQIATADIVQKLRGVIDTLQKVKSKLATLADVK